MEERSPRQLQQDLLQDWTRLAGTIEGAAAAKFYHLQTAANLIHHFTGIVREEDRLWVYNRIVSFLSACTIMSPVTDRELSAKLYSDYLAEVILFYRANLRFSLMIANPVFSLLYILLTTLGFFFLPLYAFIAMMTLITLAAILGYRKYRARRVYAAYW